MKADRYSTVLIAIGANLPGTDGASPLEACHRAAAALDGLGGLRLCALSGWYETSPVPASDQPPYVNGVARLCGAVDPARLLASLHLIEARAGRVRHDQNAARPLDLDIIAIDDLVRQEPDPVLPHPRAHERAFVLVPLMDVAPEWRHPRLCVPARVLLARLSDQGCRRL